MEEEIHQQIVSLSNLHVQRNNSVLPVFRLPPETLEIIFILGARDYFESDNGGRFNPYIPTWVNVSYVCTHWRTIALNCPTLWAFHFNVSLRWTEELLLRSKQVFLKISCVSSLYEHLPLLQDLLEKLLERSEYIQELRLSGLPPSLADKLSLRTPHLKKLDLEGTFVDSITITDIDKLPLDTLKLSNNSLPWHSFNLSGLKSLSLCSVYPPSPPNMAEFLAILGSIRNLTSLHLDDVLPGPHDLLSDGNLGVPSKTTLPCLTFLSITELVSSVVAFLSYVNIPPKTQLHLLPLHEPGVSPSDYIPISSFLEKHLAASGLIFRSLALHAGYLPKLTLGLDCNPFSLDHDIPLCINFLSDMGSDTHHILSNICCSLPLRNVETLRITRPVFLSDSWREILGCLDGVRYMKLSYGHMPDLSLLSLPARESNDNPSGQCIPEQDSTPSHMFVPALERLELCDIRFIRNNVVLEGCMSREALFDTLSSHKGLQDRVTMTRCSLADDIIPYPDFYHT